jgi:hypothetical protein
MTVSFLRLIIVFVTSQIFMLIPHNKKVGA